MKSPLRILFVNRMAGMVRGGGETFDLEISSELARMGCEVTFLTGQPLFGSRKSEVRSRKPSVNIQHSILNEKNPTHSKFEIRNFIIDFHYLRSPFLPWFPWDKVRAGWRVRVWEFQQFEKKAAGWIQKHADEFDIIQICELPYLVSLLNSKYEIRNSKIVVRLTAPNAHDPWGGIKMADAVIASGTSIAKVRKGLRSDVQDVPNGVDLRKFGDKASGLQSRASAFRMEHSIPANAPMLLYVARYQDFKKHKLLIDAFARVSKVVPEARLVLAGSGPLQGEVERQVKAADLDDRVIQLGEMDFDALPALYASADIKVISSEYESFCFAAIEGMASGLPVVTTDCGWVPKLIGDELSPIEKQWASGGDTPGRFEIEKDGKRIRKAPGGLVTSRIEPESLAHAIEMMIRDQSMRHSCGEWNYKKAVKDHGWESSAKKLLAVYEDLLSEVGSLKSERNSYSED